MWDFRKKTLRARDVWLNTFRNGENVAALYRDDQGVMVYWSLERNGVFKRHFIKDQDAIDFAKDIISSALEIVPPDESE